MKIIPITYMYKNKTSSAAMEPIGLQWADTGQSRVLFEKSNLPARPQIVMLANFGPTFSNCCSFNENNIAKNK